MKNPIEDYSDRRRWEEEDEERGSETGNVSIPREMLEDLIKNTIDLRAERSRWRDEPRMGMTEAYAEYSKQIDRAYAILDDELV